MENSTTIKRMLSGNKITVPDYQRAYSWDSEQITDFLRDIEDKVASSSATPYYFGHFLFKENGENQYEIIDGQQRLTTIVICLSALFSKLESIRPLNEEEIVIFEDVIKRGSSYRFETVTYDSQIFKDYVIDQSTKAKPNIETKSANRFIDAFKFFKSKYAKQNEKTLLSHLSTIVKANCTTHIVKDEAEAIQMFIFQNNRGKKPSDLEIIKARFLFEIHLKGADETQNLINEVKGRFETIYKSIASIEDYVDENDVLSYTLKIYFNSLEESSPVSRVNEKLSNEGKLEFIKDFSYALEDGFRHLNTFYNKDSKKHFSVYKLIILGRIGVILPFIIKAYKNGLGSSSQLSELCDLFTKLVLRHRLIGTKAKINTRIDDVFKTFHSSDISEIVITITNNILNVSSEYYWWSHWNGEALASSIKGQLDHNTAKFILWTYENHLKKTTEQGYKELRYDDITASNLEHIAPQTPTKGEPIAAGYPEYDEEFKNMYLDNLGNYLLTSGSHNKSIGNKPFKEKLDTYHSLRQQVEVKDMAGTKGKWTKALIDKRKEKIINFVLDNF